MFPNTFVRSGLLQVATIILVSAGALLIGQRGCEGPQSPPKKPTPTIPRPNEEQKHRNLPHEKPDPKESRDFHFVIERNLRQERTAMVEMKGRKFRIHTPLPEGVDIHTVREEGEEICMDVTMGDSCCTVVVPSTVRKNVLTSCSPNKKITMNVPYILRMREEPPTPGWMGEMAASMQFGMNAMKQKSAACFFPNPLEVTIEELAPEPALKNMVSVQNPHSK